MEQLDPEMIKNLDLLLDMDVTEQEADWDTMENLEEAQASEAEEK